MLDIKMVDLKLVCDKKDQVAIGEHSFVCGNGKMGPNSKRESFLAQLPDLRKLYDTHENSNSVRDTTVTVLLLSPSILTAVLSALYIIYLYLK